MITGIETKTKNINNKLLFKEIDDLMIEVFGTIGVGWKNRTHREALVEMVDDLMSELAAETGKIVQYDVICDARNNSDEDRKSGLFRFTIKYKQKNCYNTTEVEYVIHP